jgi:signal transduction histidine kinase/DNA-binding response OmpR family regulator
MKLRPGASRTLFETAAILLAAHATLLVFHPEATLLSNLFSSTLLLLAAILCLVAAHIEGKETRPLWLLLGAGFFLAMVGQLGWTYSAFAADLHIRTQAFNFDFFFFAYGIPVLLAICSRDKGAGLKTFAWLDGAQALIAAVLSYLLLFSVLPADARPRPISASSLMYLTDAANWILVAAVSLRFFSNPTPARRRFYRILAPYLWVNAVVALILTYLELERGWRDGRQDIAWGLPELVLCASFALEARVPADNREPRAGHQSMQPIALLIDNLSPVLFTLAIALMGVEIAPEHPWLAFVCISAAVAIYGVRAASLQVGYAKSQEKLTTAMIATEQASLAKSQFLANMSHEIRTPMNGILGMTELTLDSDLTVDQRSNLQMVKASADSLLQIINDILDFSKIEARKLVLDSASFSLRDSLSTAVKALGLRASAKRLELICDVDAKVPDRLIGDPLRLRQIVTNLVGNAIKFTEHGEVAMRVEIAEEEETLSAAPGSNIMLHGQVKDTGIGIPLDKQQVIFEEFSQADNSNLRKFGGTGLGLTITSQLVALMGGRVWVESEVGAGSTFHFTVRFEESAEPVQEGPRIGTDLEQLSVLIVDDNDTNRKMLEEVLISWRMCPTGVSSGASALAAMKRAASDGVPFPLVLLDVCMPDLDGYGTAELIKDDPELAGASIMMLSSADRDAAPFRELGVACYLRKPIGQSELFDALMTVLSEPGPDTALPMPAPVTPAQGQRSLRILLAEDNKVNQAVATGMLRKLGHQVVVAGNGLEALALLNTMTIDLLLMDIQMPEMDGFAATAAIREREKTTGGHLGIVALTAHAMQGDRERLLAAGMDGYMSKPIRTQELIAILEEFDGRRQGSTAVTETPSPPRQSPVNEADLLERVGGDLVLLAELTEIFRGTYPAQLIQAKRALEMEDGEELRRVGHSLRGSLANLGATEACALAASIEEFVGTGKLFLAAPVLRQLQVELGRVCVSLELLYQQQAAASMSG